MPETQNESAGAQSLLALLRGESNVEFDLDDVRAFARLDADRQAKILSRLQLAQQFDPAQSFDFATVIAAVGKLLN